MAKKCDLISDIGVMSGHNVSHSKRKTKRKFLPNLQKLSLKSDTLGVNITLRVAAKTLRTINKYGNLDTFLINFRFANLTDKAIVLRNKIKKVLIKKGSFDDIKVKSRGVGKKVVKEAKEAKA